MLVKGATGLNLLRVHFTHVLQGYFIGTRRINHKIAPVPEKQFGITLANSIAIFIIKTKTVERFYPYGVYPHTGKMASSYWNKFGSCSICNLISLRVLFYSVAGIMISCVMCRWIRRYYHLVTVWKYKWCYKTSLKRVTKPRLRGCNTDKKTAELKHQERTRGPSQ